MVTTSAVASDAPENSAGYHEWNGTSPFRIMTATATSQPPAAPIAPLPVSQGGSVTSSVVPATMQVSAAPIAKP